MDCRPASVRHSQKDAPKDALDSLNFKNDSVRIGAPQEKSHSQLNAVSPPE